MTDDEKELIETMAKAIWNRTEDEYRWDEATADAAMFVQVNWTRADVCAALTALREAGYEVRRKVSYDLEKAFAYPDPPMPEVKKGDVVKMPDTFRFPYGVVDDGGEA